VRIFRTLRELGIGAVAGLFGGRSVLASRRCCGRGVPDRAGSGRGELPEPGKAARDGRARRRRGPYTPATGFSPRTPASHAPAKPPGSSGSARRPWQSMSWAPRPRRERRCRPRGVRSSRGQPRLSSPPKRSFRLGEELGWPIAIKAAAGGGRERSQVRGGRGRSRPRLRVRSPRGRGVLLERRGLRRALPRESAPRRGPDSRRRSRQRHPPRRARLHDPTPSPEARGGDSLPGCRRGATRADRSDRHRRCPGGGLPQRGHPRRAARPRRQLLLPGDEHPDPGVEHTVTELVTGLDLVRGAGSHRGWGAAMAAPGRRPVDRARDRSAGSMRRIRRTAFCPVRGGSRAYREPGGPGVRVDSGVAAGSEVVGLYDP